MSDHLSDAQAEFHRCLETRDVELAEQVLDSDFHLLLLFPTKAVVSRARWLEMLPDYVLHEYLIEDQIVDEEDNLAVVFQRVHMRATVLGEDRSGVFAITDTWRRKSEKWGLWRRHSTPLTAGPMPGAD